MTTTRSILTVRSREVPQLLAPAALPTCTLTPRSVQKVLAPTTEERHMPRRNLIASRGTGHRQYTNRSGMRSLSC